MAGNLQRRIDFALAYEMAGQDQVDAMGRSLSNLEESGTNVNEMTEQARQKFAEYAESLDQSSQSAATMSTQQMDMALSGQQMNEILQNVVVDFELLRLEYEQGSISQDQYRQGIKTMVESLNEFETHSLSSARMLRRLTNEQALFNAEGQRAQGNVQLQARTINSLSRVMLGFGGGIQDVLFRLPFLSQNLARTTAVAGGFQAAVQGAVGFLLGPTGMILAISTLLPLLLLAARRFNLLGGEVLDVDRISKDYVRTLNEQIRAIQDLSQASTSIFNIEDDEKRLRLYQEALAIEKERLSELRAEIAPRAQATRQGILALNSQRLTTEKVNERKILKEIINQLSAEEQKIQEDLLRIELMKNNVVFQRLDAERVAVEEEERRIERGIAIARDQERLLQIERAIAEIERDARERAIADELERQAEAFQQMLDRMRMIENIPDDSRAGIEDARDERDIRSGLVATELAEQARLALIRDSLTQEEFLRRHMELRFNQQRLDLIRQGFTDEQQLRQALNNLRILQEQELQDLLNELENQARDSQLALWEQFANSMQGFGEVIFGASEQGAKQAFELNKALALAQATVFGAQAVIRAYAEGGPLAAGLVAASVAAEIAKIAATQFRARGRRSAGERPQIAFRGISADTAQGTAVHAQPQLEIPDTIRLTDSAGNFLTELEWARDRDGNAPYIV